ncbi:MAG: choice-of-anchor E domain-containing protein [Rhodocyclaceae bacterium]|nr:choice-of-anchor E domain-containing protein [Rhodocyclaceae bacterium]
MNKIVAAMALAFAASAAQATPVSQVVNFGTTPSAGANWGSDFATAVTLSGAQFNQVAVGHSLLKIDVAVTNTTNTDATLHNTNTSAATYHQAAGDHVNSLVNIYLYDQSGNYTLDSAITNISYDIKPGGVNLTLAANGDVSGLDWHSFGAKTQTVTTSTSYTAANGAEWTALLAEFVGAGTVNVDANAYGSASTQGPQNVDFSPTAFASGGVTVTYWYDVTTVVPEPGSLVLLGASMLGLAAARRRRS